MTTRRIHLKDYTDAELREMPAGPLADWLVAQATGATVDDWNGLSWNIATDDGLMLHWEDDEDAPAEHYQAHRGPSSHWSAAGPLLTRMMRDNGARLSEPHLGEYCVTFCDTPDSLAVHGAHAGTPMLAVCRAALVLARRKLDAKEAPHA